MILYMYVSRGKWGFARDPLICQCPHNQVEVVVRVVQEKECVVEMKDCFCYNMLLPQ